MQRDRRPEVMDQPGLDPAEHDRALQGLRRINRISRCVPGLFHHVETLAGESPATQLSVLELAAEVAIRRLSLPCPGLRPWAKRRGGAFRPTRVIFI